MSTALDLHSEHCMCSVSMYLPNEEQIFPLHRIRVFNHTLPSIKASIKQTYWF